MKYYIYKTTNTSNNKIYIGVHKTDNPNDEYLGSGKWIKRAIKKYGKDKFIKEILYEYDNKKDAYLKESQIVTSEFIEDVNNYNLNVGGKGGFGHINNNGLNGNSKSQLSQKLLRENDPEWVQNKSRNCSIVIKSQFESGVRSKKDFHCDWTGKNHKEESKKKISLSHKGKHKGTNNSNYGNMWIYNLELQQCKLIKKDSIIPNNWLKGRKMF